jgi:REP element-mobilizing transposase RayT
MTRPHQEFNLEVFPLGYLITFRAFGTWLNGDSRGSVDRFHNQFGSPLIPRNSRWRRYNQRMLKRPPVSLRRKRRTDIQAAIKETCRIRGWTLWAINVRTNHVHSVVTASCPPELVLIAFKANATRKRRETGTWRSGHTPWVAKGSKRRLWTQQDLINAIVYVEYEQGLPLP